MSDIIGADIIAAIDKALGCQGPDCGKPLGDSPDDDFCSPRCFQSWHAARAIPSEEGDPGECGPEAGLSWPAQQQVLEKLQLSEVVPGILFSRTRVAASLRRRVDDLLASRTDLERLGETWEHWESWFGGWRCTVEVLARRTVDDDPGELPYLEE